MQPLVHVITHLPISNKEELIGLLCLCCSTMEYAHLERRDCLREICVHDTDYRDMAT